MNMVNWINDRAVSIKKFDGMSDGDKLKHFPVGVIHEDTDRSEYTDTYEALITKLREQQSA